MKTDRQKSERNRTLTLSTDEAWALSLNLWEKENPYVDDVVVNCDIFEYIDRLPDGHFDMLLVDPPYNLTKIFNTTKFTLMGEEPYIKWLRSWFNPLVNKLKPNGSLYMCSDWKSTSAMQRVISERMTILNRITWQREKGRGSKSNWKNSMEDIWFAVRNPSSYTFNLDAVKIHKRVNAPYKTDGEPKDWKETEEGKQRLTCPSNFWDDITVPFWSMPENTLHPTQKPEKLFAKLILASTNEGDVILDPFLGSGTSAVVAKKLGRHYCGVEIDLEYCLWALKRLQMAETDKRIQGYENGIFYERNFKK